MVGDTNAELGQLFFVADTGQHQQLGSVHRTGTQHHFAGGPDRLPAAVGVVELDPDRTAALEDHPAHRRVGQQGQIRAVQHRLEVGIRGTPPGTAALRHRGFAEPVEHRRVGRGHPVAGLLGSPQPCCRRRPRTALRRDHQCGVLHPVEVGPQMRVIPVLAGVLRPLVIVGRKAGHPHHRVHRRRPAEHFAARPIDLAPRHLLLRLGEVIPVHRAAEKFGEGCRDVDELVLVHGSGFEDDDVCSRIGAQPVGENRSGRSGTHYGEIAFHRRSIGTRARYATSRIGRRLSPLLRFDRIRTGSPMSSMPPKVPRSSAKNFLPSSRARCAPRQK